ncbi:MAG: hypothetical protein J6D28_03920 [Bacilli bacterium]|nr:hypothetical protein [Bacilli bacterium]
MKVDAISPLNMLNVYSNKYQLCIASEIIDSKTNEIPTVEKLLGLLDIKDTVVTWDALKHSKGKY